jgi:nucleoside-diphosphate-sugar epimerase
MRILVTGGAGYVGSRLVPQLLEEGHWVTVYDRCWFGEPQPHDRLLLIKSDIRDSETFEVVCRNAQIEIVIHLACISNDTSCQLDEKLSTTINYDAFEPLVIAAKRAGVKRFIYCSSSSVYGVSDAPEVYEDQPLVPLTLYNKYKGLCEPILFRHMADDFTTVVIRPATVCGYAPRMRFDLTVNIMTNHAAKNGVITVFGGQQKRPNLHIDDMCDVYKLLLTAPKEKIQGQIFNVGYANMRVSEIAELVSKVVGDEFETVIPIQTQANTDNRSYHIDSSKIKRVLGFEPKRTVEDAIRGICERFKAGEMQDSLTNPIYLNIGQYLESGIG